MLINNNRAKVRAEMEANETMKVTTFEATVENGRIKLPENIRLPEKTRVYVVVPGIDMHPLYYIGSPHLAHPEDAIDFVKEVTEERKDAGIQ